VHGCDSYHLVLGKTYHLTPLPQWALTVACHPDISGQFEDLMMVFHRNPVAAVARWVDTRSAFKRAMSPALEVTVQPTETAWQGLVLFGREQTRPEHRCAQSTSVDLSKSVRWAVVVLVLGAGLGSWRSYSRTSLFRNRRRTTTSADGPALADLTRA